jgi:hypothetical protein
MDLPDDVHDAAALLAAHAHDEDYVVRCIAQARTGDDWERLEVAVLGATLTAGPTDLLVTARALAVLRRMGVPAALDVLGSLPAGTQSATGEEPLAMVLTGVLLAGGSWTEFQEILRSLAGVD